jgi:hypothetical protein
MKKSISLCEFSNTPSVSLMKDKRGQNIGAGAAPQAQQQGQTESPPPKDKPAKEAAEDEDMFAIE